MIWHMLQIPAGAMERDVNARWRGWWRKAHRSSGETSQIRFRRHVEFQVSGQDEPRIVIEHRDQVIGCFLFGERWSLLRPTV